MMFERILLIFEHYFRIKRMDAQYYQLYYKLYEKWLITIDKLLQKKDFCIHILQNNNDYNVITVIISFPIVC